MVGLRGPEPGVQLPEGIIPAYPSEFCLAKMPAISLEWKTKHTAKKTLINNSESDLPQVEENETEPSVFLALSLAAARMLQGSERMVIGPRITELPSVS